MQKEPQMFYEDIRIGAIFDNFPNCLWNGGMNTFGKLIFSKEQKKIMNSFNQFGIPLRLTMTNSLITEKECYDRYSNYIMENLNNGFNQVIVSSPTLESYIRKTYPEYPIVRSILATENIYYDDSDKYFMSVLKREKNNDLEFLNSIKNKNKIEILVNEICKTPCERVYTHYEDISKIQMLKDNKEEINLDCEYKKRKKFKYKTERESSTCLSRKEIKEIYEPLGFTNFKLSGRQALFPISIDYANHFIKPEWKDDFLALMLKPAILDYNMIYN